MSVMWWWAFVKINRTTCLKRENHTSINLALTIKHINNKQSKTSTLSSSNIYWDWVEMAWEDRTLKFYIIKLYLKNGLHKSSLYLIFIRKNIYPRRCRDLQILYCSKMHHSLILVPRNNWQTETIYRTLNNIYCVVLKICSTVLAGQYELSMGCYKYEDSQWIWFLLIFIETQIAFSWIMESQV